MKTLYHGTTKAGFELIKSKGFGYNNSTWNCSGTIYTYFYDLDEFESKEQAIYSAFENACIIAAYHMIALSECVFNYEFTKILML